MRIVPRSSFVVDGAATRTVKPFVSLDRPVVYTKPYSLSSTSENDLTNWYEIVLLLLSIISLLEALITCHDSRTIRPA